MTRTIEEVVRYPARHLRVLGPPASGKTALLIERYRYLTASDPSAAFIITYSRGQLKQTMNDILADGSAHAGLPPVMTHYMLAREVMTGAGVQPPRVMTDLEEELLVERVVRKSERNLQSDYRRVAASETLHRNLLGVFHLFLQNGLSDEDLTQRTGNSRRLRDIVRLYGAYRRELADEGRATFYDVAWRAREVCGKLADDHPLRRAAVVLVDDFQDIDRAQFELLKSLFPPGGSTALNVFGDPFGAMFAFRGTRVDFLRNAFPDDYDADTRHLTATGGGASGLSKTLAALATEILGEEGSAYAPAQAPPAEDLGPLFAQTVAPDQDAPERVTVTVVEDEIEEVHAAASRALALIGDGVRPWDIAVVTNVKSRYEPMLRAAFLQHGVPLETGRPIQGAFRGFVHALLQLLAAPRRSAALQAFMTSSFYPYFRETRLAGGRMTDVHAASNATLEWLRDAAARLESVDARRWIDEIFDNALAPVCSAYMEQTGDDAVYSFISILRERWNEYVEATAGKSQPGLAAFVTRSRLFRAESTAPLPARDEVGFYSCREMKGRKFRAVIVLGASELIFPGVPRRDTVLPVGPLEALLAQVGVPFYEAQTPTEHLTEEYHLLYGTLARARETLQIYAPRSFAGQEYPAPAALVRDAMTVAHLERSHHHRPPPVRFAELWSVPDVSSPSWPGEPPGARLVQQAGPGELSPMGHMWHDVAATGAAFSLKAFPLSKSALETYVKCPRKFFYQKILRVDDEGSGPLIVGNIFHRTMAALNARFRSKRELHEGVDDDMIARALRDEIARENIAPESLFGRSMEFWNRYMVKGALRLDRTETEDYEVASVESDLAFEHSGFEFRGRTDLVFRTSEGDHMLDYKTGEFQKRGATLRDRTLDALDKPDKANWQVPIYVCGHRASSQSKRAPATFRHLVQQPGNNPFFVTLFVVASEADIPSIAVSRKRDHQGYSYVLESEVDAVMDRAVDFAGEIFAEREGFARTDDIGQCRNCMFARLCERRVD